jgi:hypothetical protein
MSNILVIHLMKYTSVETEEIVEFLAELFVNIAPIDCGES